MAMKLSRRKLGPISYSRNRSGFDSTVDDEIPPRIFGAGCRKPDELGHDSRTRACEWFLSQTAGSAIAGTGIFTKRTQNGRYRGRDGRGGDRLARDRDNYRFDCIRRRKADESFVRARERTGNDSFNVKVTTISIEFSLLPRRSTARMTEGVNRRVSERTIAWRSTKSPLLISKSGSIPCIRFCRDSSGSLLEERRIVYRLMVKCGRSKMHVKLANLTRSLYFLVASASVFFFLLFLPFFSPKICPCALQS